MKRLRFALPILFLPLILPSAGNARDPLPDPTRPPASLAHSAQTSIQDPDTKLDLRAIFFSDGRRLAVINGQRLREQDRIGSARVLEIMPDRVRLTRDGGEFELTLIHFDIKTRPESAHANANGSPAITTKNPVKTTTPRQAAIASVDSSAPPAEAWGGPSTAPAPPSFAHADAALAPLADSPAAPSTDRSRTHSVGDWDDPASSLQTGRARPSENQTPSWIDTLLGEGK